MNQEIFDTILKIFNIDAAIINNNVYCGIIKVGSIEILDDKAVINITTPNVSLHAFLKEEAKLCAYISGVMDQKNTHTTVEFTYKDMYKKITKGNIVFNNEIVFGPSINTNNPNYTIFKNETNISSNFENNNGESISLTNWGISYNTKDGFLSIVNNNDKDELNIFMIIYHGNTKTRLEIKRNKDHIMFSKSNAKIGSLSEETNGAYLSIELYDKNEDYYGLKKINQLISDFLPEYYEELRKNFKKLNVDVINNINSLNYNQFTSEDYEALLGLTKNENSLGAINENYLKILNKRI